MLIRQVVPAFAWFIVALSLLPASLATALGQEPPAAPPATSEPEAAPIETDDPATAPDEETRKRRLFKRLGPQALTPEEQREAARLSRIAAKQGTDPTAILGRVQVAYEYTALTQGSRTNTFVERVDLAYRGDWVLRVDAPQVWLDPNLPRTSNQSGMSDLFARVGSLVYKAPGYAFFAGMDFGFPTAVYPALGLGKYTIGPLAATARAFPNLHSILFGFLEHQLSVGGDPSRQKVQFSHLGAIWNTVWSERWWTQVGPSFGLDWERNEKTNMNLEFEGGWSITREWRVFVHPAVGLWGRDVLGGYDWAVQAGARRMFPSF